MHPLEYWDNQLDLDKIRIKKYKKLNITVGRKLRDQRKMDMLTQGELAKKTRRHQNKHKQHGKRRPVANIAKRLQISNDF